MDVFFCIRLPNMAIISCLLIFGLALAFFGLGFIVGRSHDSTLLTVFSVAAMAVGSLSVTAGAFAAILTHYIKP